MHIVLLVMALVPLTPAVQGQAPTPPPPDTVPAATNVQGAQYPRITSASVSVRPSARRSIPRTVRTFFLSSFFAWRSASKIGRAASRR